MFVLHGLTTVLCGLIQEFKAKCEAFESGGHLECLSLEVIHLHEELVSKSALIETLSDEIDLGRQQAQVRLLSLKDQHPIFLPKRMHLNIVTILCYNKFSFILSSNAVSLSAV